MSIGYNRKLLETFSRLKPKQSLSPSENWPFQSKTLDSICVRQTTLDTYGKHFQGLPSSYTLFFFCLLSVPNWSFPWKTLDSIYGHWNPSDSDSTQFWGLPSTSTWFFSKVSHSLSENWSLWLNPLDAIHVHQKISDTDGRIHIINLMTSGVINHDHSQ